MRKIVCNYEKNSVNYEKNSVNYDRLTLTHNCYIITFQKKGCDYIFLVTKANGLIEARYKLTVEEQRLILYLVSLIEPKDEDFKKYEISIKEFTKMVNLKVNSQYEQFKKMSKSLISKTITIKEEDGSTTITAWLSSTNYNKGKGIIKISFAPELKPYLLQLKKNFTSYNLSNVLYLKSVYTTRIFELLKQYEKLKFRVFEIDKLKECLCIDEVKSYNLYGDFKRSVILPAQKELKEKCDIWFDFEEIKEGRKVAKIKFNIHKNVEEEEEKVIKPKVKVTRPIKPKIENPLHMEFIEKLKGVIEEKLPLADLKAIGEASNYDIDVAINAYRFTKQQNTVSSLTGYVIWACKRPVEKSSPVSIRKPIEQEPNKTTWDFELLQLVERASLMQGAGMEVDEDLMAKIRARREKS